MAYFWVLAFVDLAVWSMLAIVAGCHIFGSMVMNIVFAENMQPKDIGA